MCFVHDFNINNNNNTNNNNDDDAVKFRSSICFIRTSLHELQINEGRKEWTIFYLSYPNFVCKGRHTSSVVLVLLLLVLIF